MPAACEADFGTGGAPASIRSRQLLAKRAASAPRCTARSSTRRSRLQPACVSSKNARASATEGMRRSNRDGSGDRIRLSVVLRDTGSIPSAEPIRFPSGNRSSAPNPRGSVSHPTSRAIYPAKSDSYPRTCGVQLLQTARVDPDVESQTADGKKAQHAKCEKLKTSPRRRRATNAAHDSLRTSETSGRVRFARV